jgi:hypothetical protein
MLFACAFAAGVYWAEPRLTLYPMFLVVTALLVLGAPGDGDEDGFDTVARSAEATRSTAYVGETLWITFDEDRPYVTKVGVAASGNGEVVVEMHGSVRVRVAEDRAGLEHASERWAMPLPGAPDDLEQRLATLARNYEVDVEQLEDVMARPCTVVAFQRRGDGTVRERLWVDEDSGLPLRRETFAPDGELVRLGTFLTLDLEPEFDDASRGEALEERTQGVMPVDEAELDALRKAGWIVPETLPGGYEVMGAFAVAAEGTQPLQVVYGDGLYTVSVFQQAGAADWESLPPDRRLVEDLPGVVYEWPGALPLRWVWSVDGRTWSLVGDAPPDDLRAIAEVLPRAEGAGVLDRLRRGFSRLWSGVSEWGRNLWN